MSDIVWKEVMRYQSGLGQVIVYMIGQLKIIDFREYVMKEFGDDFNLKDFYFYFLV